MDQEIDQVDLGLIVDADAKASQRRSGQQVPAFVLGEGNDGISGVGEDRQFDLRFGGNGVVKPGLRGPSGSRRRIMRFLRNCR